MTEPRESEVAAETVPDSRGVLPEEGNVKVAPVHVKIHCVKSTWRVSVSRYGGRTVRHAAKTLDEALAFTIKNVDTATEDES